MNSVKVRNQKAFEISVDKFAKQIGVDVVTVVKKLSFDIFADVVAGTPVDTGRAMNNWNISVGSINPSVNDIGGSANTLAAAKRASAPAKLAGIRPFDTVWISNHLPYIGFLEEGSSSQAPNGWVSQAIQRNLSQLARFAL